MQGQASKVDRILSIAEDDTISVPERQSLVRNEKKRPDAMGVQIEAHCLCFIHGYSSRLLLLQRGRIFEVYDPGLLWRMKTVRIHLIIFRKGGFMRQALYGCAKITEQIAEQYSKIPFLLPTIFVVVLLSKNHMH